MSDEEADCGIAGLIRRVQALEDTVAIYRLVATYGPAVDSNALGVATELWTEDGVYDIEVGTWRGQTEIRELFESEVHQNLVRDGCSHQVSFPRVSLDGDTAVVTCYQQLVHHEGDGFGVPRQSANRWELARTSEGWRIVRRFSRKLDGSAEAREVLQRDLRAQG
jgi:hypothetical protein